MAPDGKNPSGVFIMSESVFIESLDGEGRGVARLKNDDQTLGKVVFVEGALAGEEVIISTFRKKKNWEMAKVVTLLRESPFRVKPRCPSFGICGGCSMQHMDPTAQVAVKQRTLEDNLKHIGQVLPERMIRPIYGPYWAYRYRARLSVNYVPKKGGVLIGFRERKSHYVTDMTSCAILPKHVSDLLVPLRELIGGLSLYNKIPQIEVAVSEHQKKILTVFVFRIMEALTPSDEEKLRFFAMQYDVAIWLQTKGVDTIHPFYPKDSYLQYDLDEFNVTMPFRPSDFTQINHFINPLMVSKAIRLLEIQPQDIVGDLFCGLGNFTLPIARYAQKVIGIEGSDILTKRAQEVALLNGLENKAQFITQNLFEMNEETWLQLEKMDRLLLDPPRDGAFAVCQTIAALTVEKPKRIVYVSCNPATLARDAGVLVNEGGYQLKLAGSINMFPHTAHVESIAMFDYNNLS